MDDVHARSHLRPGEQRGGGRGEEGERPFRTLRQNRKKKTKSTGKREKHFVDREDQTEA